MCIYFFVFLENLLPLPALFFFTFFVIGFFSIFVVCELHEAEFDGGGGGGVNVELAWCGEFDELEGYADAVARVEGGEVLPDEFRLGFWCQFACMQGQPVRHQFAAHGCDFVGRALLAAACFFPFHVYAC